MTPPSLGTGLIIAITTALLTSAPVTAQRPLADLDRLQTDYEKTVIAASRRLDDIHRLTLRQLERERAGNGDYETAAKVKARLESLENKAGTPPITPPPLTHTLPAGRAQTRDGANAEGGREYVDFKKQGGKAIWDVLALEKGTYEIILTYSVGLPRFDAPPLATTTEPPREAPGGVILFSELSKLGGASVATLEKKVVTTGAWENYIRESIGRHDFRSTNTTIKLEAAQATTGGLLRVRQIELIKVVPGPAAAPAADDSPAPDLTPKLQELRSRFEEELTATTAPVRLQFTADLRQLETERLTAGDQPGATLAARTREQIMAPPAPSPATPAPPTPAAVSTSMPSAPSQVGMTGEATLDRLIREYAAQRTVIERPLLAAHAQRLTSLRERLEQRRDPAATAVGKALTAVYAQLTNPENQTPAAPEKPLPTRIITPVELDGSTAKTNGGATTLGEGAGPVHFATKGSNATWPLPPMPAGRYRLLWNVACDVGAGAIVRLTVDDLPPRPLHIQPTTKSGDTIVANLGEFTAATPPSTLKIEVLEVPGRGRKVGPSFSLRKIILIPPGVTMPGL
jgi:hypothetical protein